VLGVQLVASRRLKLFKCYDPKEALRQDKRLTWAWLPALFFVREISSAQTLYVSAICLVSSIHYRSKSKTVRKMEVVRQPRGLVFMLFLYSLWNISIIAVPDAATDTQREAEG
jgi:hypothetical protein